MFHFCFIKTTTTKPRTKNANKQKQQPCIASYSHNMLLPHLSCLNTTCSPGNNNPTEKNQNKNNTKKEEKANAARIQLIKTRYRKFRLQLHSTDNYIQKGKHFYQTIFLLCHPRTFHPLLFQTWSQTPSSRAPGKQITVELMALVVKAISQEQTCLIIC